MLDCCDDDLFTFFCAFGSEQCGYLAVPTTPRIVVTEFFDATSSQNIFERNLRYEYLTHSLRVLPLTSDANLRWEEDIYGLTNLENVLYA